MDGPAREDLQEPQIVRCQQNGEGTTALNSLNQSLSALQVPAEEDDWALTRLDWDHDQGSVGAADTDAEKSASAMEEENETPTSLAKLIQGTESETDVRRRPSESRTGIETSTGRKDEPQRYRTPPIAIVEQKRNAGRQKRDVPGPEERNRTGTKLRTKGERNHDGAANSARPTGSPSGILCEQRKRNGDAQTKLLPWAQASPSEIRSRTSLKSETETSVGPRRLLRDAQSGTRPVQSPHGDVNGNRTDPQKDEVGLIGAKRGAGTPNVNSWIGTRTRNGTQQNATEQSLWHAAEGSPTEELDPWAGCGNATPPPQRSF
ncbi:hypothetical protein KFL_013290020 [Klebsormidium nitens]|uniref:Uncharacterized protein n=1 Tax=Klebsormidium nitens TaxID=105231 RepID=A0A1Y1IXY1_KLENI|nr:hypothetical protein KFL_013290020 [Klebsormidium nitens]|eukprot:GAQ93158.1 hypothetical protein KFL_013290020 [Klebsormidium nitens]